MQKTENITNKCQGNEGTMEAGIILNKSVGGDRSSAKVWTESRESQWKQSTFQLRTSSILAGDYSWVTSAAKLVENVLSSGWSGACGQTRRTNKSGSWTWNQVGTGPDQSGSRMPQQPGTLSSSSVYIDQCDIMISTSSHTTITLFENLH